MYAAVGDRLLVKGRVLGDAGRDGEILDVPHRDGTPPYVVRWADTGRTSLFFPGPDAIVHHFQPRRAEREHRTPHPPERPDA